MIKIIAAIGRKNELGKKGDLIWHLPSDLKFFKEQTLGGMVFMGRTTFLSLPKLLPNRKHVVLTPNEPFNKDITDVVLLEFKDDFVNYCIEQSKTQDVYIIGGASIYNMFIDIADVLVLTEIDAEDSEADVYFPSFDKNKYIKENLGENVDGKIRFKHVKYTKKN